MPEFLLQLFIFVQPMDQVNHLRNQVWPRANVPDASRYLFQKEAAVTRPGYACPVHDARRPVSLVEDGPKGVPLAQLCQVVWGVGQLQAVHNRAFGDSEMAPVKAAAVEPVLDGYVLPLQPIARRVAFKVALDQLRKLLRFHVKSLLEATPSRSRDGRVCFPHVL